MSEVAPAAGAAGPTRSVAVLVNPASGRGGAARTAERVARRVVAAGDAASVLLGDTARHSTSLLREAVTGGCDLVVAVGGDGMVHLAVQELAGTPTALAIVPTGTGNDYARALGVPRGDPDAAAELAATGTPTPVDLARLDTAQLDTAQLDTAAPDGDPGPGGRWFAEVLSAGFDSRANARANAMRRPSGSLRYAAAVLAGLRDTRGMDLTVTVDGVAHHHRAELVTVGNTAYYGGGLAMLDGADPADGRLDVVVVDEVGPLRLLALFPLVYSARHLGLSIVHRYAGARIELAAPDRAVTAYADGEPFTDLPLALTCVPGALRVVAGTPPPRRSRARHAD